jgi:hypothetical protein
MLADHLDDIPDAVTLESLDMQELAQEFARLERSCRMAETRMVALVETVVKTRSYRSDGHSSPSAWCRAVGRWSAAEARDRVRTAKLASGVPAVATALANGDLGLAQARELARAFANPRCGDLLGIVADKLIDAAQRFSYDDFVTLVRRWETLADTDGAHKAADRAHQRRDASVVHTMGGVHVAAHGSGVAGAAMDEIFRRFCSAEWHADWASTKADHGEQACPDLMPRTEAQRRFDAMEAIFRQAAATPPGARLPDPLVNIVVDAETLAGAARSGSTFGTGAQYDGGRRNGAHFADSRFGDSRFDDSRFDGADVDSSDLDCDNAYPGNSYPIDARPTSSRTTAGRTANTRTSAGRAAHATSSGGGGYRSHANQRRRRGEHSHDDPGGTGQPFTDPGDLLRRRCETDRGVPITPAEALAAAIAGQVRRIVVDSTGAILAMGRRQRLFTGAAREAVLLASNHCVWPGCRVPSAACEADHLTPWAHDGPTDVSNAAPLCTRHNRFKVHGFTVWRDDHGGWHALRPDGSEIGDTG